MRPAGIPKTSGILLRRIFVFLWVFHKLVITSLQAGADWGKKVARELLSDRPTQYTARGPLSTRRAAHSIHSALPIQCIARINQSVAYYMFVF